MEKILPIQFLHIEKKFRIWDEVYPLLKQFLYVCEPGMCSISYHLTGTKKEHGEKNETHENYMSKKSARYIFFEDKKRGTT